MSVRKRTWKTRAGESKEAWIVDYAQDGERHRQSPCIQWAASREVHNRGNNRQRQRPQRIVRLNRNAGHCYGEPADDPDCQRPKCSQNGEYGYNDVNHQVTVLRGELYVRSLSDTISEALHGSG